MRFNERPILNRSMTNRAGPTQAERIALRMLPAKRPPAEPKPITIRRFSWEENS